MVVITNAMDSMPAGGTLVLRSYREAQWCVIEVSDTGVGITPEVRPNLFTPFFSTKGERGAGLGLSIALNIVTQHGGSIEIDSQPRQHN